MVEAKVTARSYYDLLPAAVHTCGDIWAPLPTFGLLGERPVHGVVVTPACDLANRKSVVVTFVPVLPLRVWLNCPLTVPSMTRELANVCQQLWPNERFAGHDDELLMDQVESVVEPIPAQASSKTQALHARVSSGLRALRLARRWATAGDGMADLVAMRTEKALRADCDRLVRNAASADLHFLPADGQDPDVAAMPEPSVALLGFPISLPLAVLSVADDHISMPDWTEALVSIDSAAPPGLRPWFAERPVRRGRLLNAFLRDLINRTVAHFVRAGSPDFSEATRDEYLDTLLARPVVASAEGTT